METSPSTATPRLQRRNTRQARLHLGGRSLAVRPNMGRNADYQRVNGVGKTFAWTATDTKANGRLNYNLISAGLRF